MADDTDDNDFPPSRPRKSPTVTPEMAIEIRRLRAQGFAQHHIAAHLGVNQGRICEVLKGKRSFKPGPQGGLF